MKHQTKKLVIFDMDGTILDTLQDLTDSINHSLRVNGFPVHSIDSVRSFVGNGRRKLVERAVPKDATADEIEAVYNELVDFYPKNCANHTKPYVGILELFEELKAKNIYVAVNSNKADDEVKILVKEYYKGLVDFSVGSFENVPKKPAPDGVLKIMEHFGVTREETVYVGDSDVDIETAVASRLDAIVVDWGFRERAYLEERVKQVLEETDYSGKMCMVSTCKEVLEKVL